MNQAWRDPYLYYPYDYNQFPYSGNLYYHTPYYPHMQANKGGEPNIETTSHQHHETANISHQIEKLSEKLSQIEEEQQQIKQDMENMNPVNVENINYKIQDLNVQDLSGTLLVGLTALSDAKKLQELLADNDAVSFNDMNTEEVANNMMNQQSEEADGNDQHG